ncbi:MAG: anaerobic sulfatase maturase [Anaerolineales bacterium]|nr:anaerobic sulfatase maturase [Anaerolineales bacterium]
MRPASQTSEQVVPAFHLLAKPSGALCNLDCKYCFFLSKEKLYPDSDFRMPDQVLESFVRQYIQSQSAPEVTFNWQGGEPTLMGLDFFRRAVALAEQYKRPGMRVHHSIQTNGILLDDEWCAFLKQHDFLVGISLDGPPQRHDVYRVDKGGQPTFERVRRGLERLQAHQVETNILCSVHAANADHPLEVYRFFRDALQVQFIQFIPIVERDHPLGYQQGNRVTERSVKPRQYGEFLADIFDEWLRRDVGRVYVQIFDIALGAWVGAPPSLCVFAPTCGDALALEHNGDLYACDHFVEPDYRLGNILETPMSTLVAAPQQRRFGQDKLDRLPRDCRECEVRFVCHGGCPKNRFHQTSDGAPGLNVLCPGYKHFFNHIDAPMRLMAFLLRQGRPPAEIMHIWPAEQALATARPGDACPCGSGRKYRQCHGTKGGRG